MREVLNTSADKNAAHKVVFFDRFQLPTGWLKAFAPQKTPPMSVAFEVSQVLIELLPPLLNEAAFLNILWSEVTWLIFQPPMFWLNADA